MRWQLDKYPFGFEATNTWFASPCRHSLGGATLLENIDALARRCAL
jgi:hypothetical protein